jgi:hypothetical protein
MVQWYQGCFEEGDFFLSKVVVVAKLQTTDRLMGNLGQLMNSDRSCW